MEHIVVFQIHLEFGCFPFGHAFGLPPSTPLPKAARPPGGAIVPESLTMMFAVWVTDCTQNHESYQWYSHIT